MGIIYCVKTEEERSKLLNLTEHCSYVYPPLFDPMCISLSQVASQTCLDANEKSKYNNLHIGNY